jgi:hypothetical protein
VVVKFFPVSTLAELDSLNQDDIVEGYRTAQCGDPEPGENRGKAFWHGWRNRMMDIGEIQHDAYSARLAHEAVKRGDFLAMFKPRSRLSRE